MSASLLLAACAGTQVKKKAPPDLSPLSLYPLHVGAAWSYDVDSGDGDPVLAPTRVTRSENGMVEVSTSAIGVVGYLLRDDGIVRVPGNGYLLKAPITQGATWTSGADTTARVTALHVALHTPAGDLEECVTVQEDNAVNGQHVTTTYCPGVGPAQVVSEMEVRGQHLRVIATLHGYTTTGE
ncbi:MAG TPA: hypothetical protein VHM19_11540 [Polyangiales bacterium]|jgi:hypothetical protein|nr:hypothetical protein [Polyangiales bacterium]